MADWLTNIALETAHLVEEGSVRGTRTERFDLRVEDGRVAEIRPAASPMTLGEAGGVSPHEGEGAALQDAGGLLALPAFREMHTHLDKTLMGDAWRPCTPWQGIEARLEEEKRLLPSLNTSMKERATLLLGEILAAGSTHIRTHIDIFPEAGLRHLELANELLGGYEGKLTHEIVAFAQHGLLRSDSAALVRDALRNGANLVGAVDPATLDGDLERSLQLMVELAVEGKAGIDLHLHDPGHLGLLTVKRLAQLTIAAGLQGRVAVSHAWGLGEVSDAEVADLADLLAEAGVQIISSVPIDSAMPPIPLLLAKGVEVSLGTDNIFDTWSPYGNANILERLQRLGEINHWVDELALSQALGLITGGRTPLDRQGKQIWPQVGDEASFVLVPASCSAEAVARRRTPRAVYYRGQLVAGNLP